MISQDGFLTFDAGLIWPHDDAKRRQLLRHVEQHPGRSAADSPVMRASGDLYGSGGWRKISLRTSWQCDGKPPRPKILGPGTERASDADGRSNQKARLDGVSRASCVVPEVYAGVSRGWRSAPGRPAHNVGTPARRPGSARASGRAPRTRPRRTRRRSRRPGAWRG